MRNCNFDDGDLVIGVKSEVADFTYALYQAAFARTPDEAGFLFWEEVMQSGFFGTGDTAELGLADAFVASEEFQPLRDLDNSADYLTALYQNVLGRAPDGPGFVFWLDQMDNNDITRPEVLRYFAISEENTIGIAPNTDVGYWFS